MKSLDLVNEVRELIVVFANKNEINLQAEFGTREKFQEFVMAFTFKQLVDHGVEVPQAFDAVFGDGRYIELVHSVWNHHNAA